MTIELTWATAGAITSDLEAARTVVDECAGSAPGSVDAGEATPLVTAMIALLLEGAAGLSEGLDAASGNVRSAAGSLQNADLAVRDTFARPGRP